MEENNSRVEKNEELVVNTRLSQKEQKRSKRRLMMLLLLLIATGAMLSTATYAWFTSNNNVTINTVTVNVATSGGIQISTDAVNWKTVITNDDIKTGGYTGNVNILPANLVNMSTAGVVDSDTGYLKMYNGTVQGDAAQNGALALTTTLDTTTETITTEGENPKTNTSGNYVAFDVFLRLEAASTVSSVQLSLNKGSGVKTNTGNDGLKNASRYAFVIEGNKDASTAVDTLTAMKGATEDTVYIVEPNFDSHTAYGITAAKNNYNITTVDGGTAVPYVGVKGEVAKQLLSTTMTAGTNFGTIAHLITTPSTFSDATTAVTDKTNLFMLSKGVTKVRIYMWVEGQDVDCENNASGSTIDFNISLGIPEE